jgi:hypothetical protein
MFAKRTLAFWAAGLLVAAVAVLALKRYFSPDARERRRRERSHGKVVSRGRGPRVKFAVKAKKSKSGRVG